MPQVHDYLFDFMARWEMQNKFRDRFVRRGDDRTMVVIAHSLGTVIAYDVIREWSRNHQDVGFYGVDLFLTLGSPLGMHAVQQTIGPLEKPHLVKRWVNIADRKDPVALDPDLSDDIPGVINHCHFGLNPHTNHPHSIEGYLDSHHTQNEMERLGIYRGGKQ